MLKFEFRVFSAISFIFCSMAWGSTIRRLFAHYIDVDYLKDELFLKAAFLDPSCGPALLDTNTEAAAKRLVLHELRVLVDKARALHNKKNSSVLLANVKPRPHDRHRRRRRQRRRLFCRRAVTYPRMSTRSHDSQRNPTTQAILN
jgi:hypothetical protein